jgi:hypothetical protein
MKNKYIAAILAFFVGAFGIHKFYLGKTGQGILHLIFFWTFISTIIAWIEAVGYLTMSDNEFDARYNYDSSDRLLINETKALQREKIKLERLRVEKQRIMEEKGMRNTSQTAETKKILVKKITGEQADELAAWRDLLDKGIIDDDAYENKRKIILGLDD